MYQERIKEVTGRSTSLKISSNYISESNHKLNITISQNEYSHLFRKLLLHWTPTFEIQINGVYSVKWNFHQNILHVHHLKLISPSCRIYASVNQVSIGSDNGLSPIRRQAITCTNAGLLLIGLLGTNFTVVLLFSFKEMHLKMSSAKLVVILSRGKRVKYADIRPPFQLGSTFGHRLLPLGCRGVIRHTGHMGWPEWQGQPPESLAWHCLIATIQYTTQSDGY